MGKLSLKKRRRLSFSIIRDNTYHAGNVTDETKSTAEPSRRYRLHNRARTGRLDK